MTVSGRVGQFGWWRMALLSLLFALIALPVWGAPLAPGEWTMEAAVERYRDKVERRLRPRFRFAGVAWPPEEMALLALKDARQLELWARDGGAWRHIRDYYIKGLSGGFGPKLREGDRQVPEGFYRIVWLNPNSAFHLSMKLDYPNLFDQEQARLEGRENPGSNIFIHGSNVSNGCLAVGDNAIEELFVLTALIGMENVSVLIAARDFRYRAMQALRPDDPPWLLELNRRIVSNMREFPREWK